MNLIDVGIVFYQLQRLAAHAAHPEGRHDKSDLHDFIELFWEASNPEYN